MRVYFLSAEPAILKLDGHYAGTIDMFERFTEIDESTGVFAEIAPYSCRGTLNFFIDDKFFRSPHDFCKTYFSTDERAVLIESYPPRGNEIEIIAQERAAGTLITVFRFGGVYAAAECGGSTINKLSEKFAEAEITEVNIGGCGYAAVRGKNSVMLFRGKNVVFFGGCEKFECGENFVVHEKLKCCTRAVKISTYTFNGDNFALESCSVKHGREPSPEETSAAFFESILNGESEKYLSEELKNKGSALKNYLGEFTDVALPTEATISKYGDDAVGLVYPRGGGLFEVKYFIAEQKDGKVTNIYPADEE